MQSQLLEMPTTPTQLLWLAMNAEGRVHCKRQIQISSVKASTSPL
jgi:hypothetical protein